MCGCVMPPLDVVGRLDDRVLFDPPELGTKLYVPFLPGGGDVLFDRSPYGAHGAISNAQWTGPPDSFLEFDYTIPSYVEIPASYDQLDFTSGEFSIVMRVYVNTPRDFSRLLSRGRSSVDGHFFFMDHRGVLEFRTSQLGAAQRTWTDVGVVTNSSLQTIGLTRDGANVTLLRNGVDVTDTPGTHIDPATSARSFKIGVDRTLGGHGLDGKVQFLLIAGRAFSVYDHQRWHRILSGSA